jgi:hypothetical protein
LKKAINILFLTLFTAISVGFTINKHYSGNQLFSIAIFSEPESCCADVCDCCNEETETIQFRADYTFSVDNFESTPSEMEFFAIAIAFTISECNFVLTETRIIDQDLPPPDELRNLSLLQTFLL